MCCHSGRPPRSRPAPKAERFELVRQIPEVSDDRGVELREEGEDGATDARPEEARIGIRGIPSVGDTMTGEVCEHVRASRPEQGTDDRDVVCARGRRPGREDRQPAEACASEKPHHERLGAVLRVMPRGDRRVSGARRLDERAPASRAGARLEVRPAPHRQARAFERNAEALRGALGKIELRGRLVAKTMVHAERDDRQACSRSDAREDVEQGHRIGAAAHRDEQGRARRERRLTPLRERPTYHGDERGLHGVSTTTVSTWLV
jgi:hypothetical protein